MLVRAHSVRSSAAPSRRLCSLSRPACHTSAHVPPFTRRARRSPELARWLPDSPPASWGAALLKLVQQLRPLRGRAPGAGIRARARARGLLTAHRARLGSLRSSTARSRARIPASHHSRALAREERLRCRPLTVLQERTGRTILSHGFGRGPRIPACPPVSLLERPNNLDCRERRPEPAMQRGRQRSAGELRTGSVQLLRPPFFVATLPFGPLVPRCVRPEPQSPSLTSPHNPALDPVWTTSVGGGPMYAVSAPPSTGHCTPLHDLAGCPPALRVVPSAGALP